MDNRNITLRGGCDVRENLFHNIVSVPNLLLAWNEFKKGKRKKKDVEDFEFSLEENIFRLHEELVSKKYKHREYVDFFVSDPKRRHIHKADVYDRVLHQAVYRVLYPIFDKHFIYDSYSSRKSKGTHLGVLRSFKSCRKISNNWKNKVYVLKCDVRKFFDSIDHHILREIIEERISCSETMGLIDLLFKSFEKEKGKGIPLGNVTSQLFANIYLNELDQFVKHKLKIKYYFRYCDDFIIFHKDMEFLVNLIEEIGIFLYEKLKLNLHPNKVEIRSIRQGVDFLGYVILPHTVVLRTKTKKRIIRNMENKTQSTLESYLGIMSHCRSRKLANQIRRRC